MKTSESIKAIAPAFLKAQMAIKNVVKDSTNPYFHSKYADLTSVINACKAELNKNDISVLQPIDGLFVETILVHVSGEWMSSSTPIVTKAQNDPQALGSAITYARRYGLQSMVLIPADDDDGNQASTQKVDKDPTEDWPDKDEMVTEGKDGMTITRPVKPVRPLCAHCGESLTEKVAKFSMEKYGKYLCFVDQKGEQILNTAD